MEAVERLSRKKCSRECCGNNKGSMKERGKEGSARGTKKVQ